MGRPKASLHVDGRPLLLLHIDVWRAAGLDVVAVVESVAAWVDLVGPGVELRENDDPLGSDMARSAAIGLAGLATVVLTPVDTPPASAEVVAALLAGGGDAVPRAGGRDGHPVRLAPPHPPGRLDLRLRPAPRLDVTDADCTLDFDTPADWSAWLTTRGR